MQIAWVAFSTPAVSEDALDLISCNPRSKVLHTLSNHFLWLHLLSTRSDRAPSVCTTTWYLQWLSWDAPPPVSLFPLHPSPTATGHKAMSFSSAAAGTTLISTSLFVDLFTWSALAACTAHKDSNKFDMNKFFQKEISLFIVTQFYNIPGTLQAKYVVLTVKVKSSNKNGLASTIIAYTSTHMKWFFISTWII